MQKKYTFEDLRKLDDIKVKDILERASEGQLNIMFGYGGLPKVKNKAFLASCLKQLREEKEDRIWRYSGAALCVELVLPENPTWEDIYEQADTYMKTEHPTGKVIGYSSNMLFDYLKENFKPPERK